MPKNSQADLKLTRLPFQDSRKWVRPTGEAHQLEQGTYNAKYGFGHEDWLFRADWLINGYRYSFLQGLNKSRRKFLGQKLDIALFILRPDRQREFVGTIYEAEPLSDEDAAWALQQFKQRGWFAQMQREISKLPFGNSAKLGDSTAAEHILNFRFRLRNFSREGAGEVLPNTRWFRNRKRYKLYDFSPDIRDDFEDKLRQRHPKDPAFRIRTIFRPPTPAGEFTVQHDVLQKRLYRLLRKDYTAEQIRLEPNYVDVVVTTQKETLLFEIKSDTESRNVIRNALGQLLEYGFHPLRQHAGEIRLIIVGQSPLRGHEATYLRTLRTRFHLPVDYWEI